MFSERAHGSADRVRPGSNSCRDSSNGTLQAHFGERAERQRQGEHLRVPIEPGRDPTDRLAGPRGYRAQQEVTSVANRNARLMWGFTSVNRSISQEHGSSAPPDHFGGPGEREHRLRPAHAPCSTASSEVVRPEQQLRQLFESGTGRPGSGEVIGVQR
jgi:hypothetical protein